MFKGGRNGTREIGRYEMALPAGNVLEQSGPCFEVGKCSGHVVRWSLVYGGRVLNCVKLLG